MNSHATTSLQAAKVDLYREYKSEYVLPRKPTLVNIGPALYLSVTGKGDPGGPEFQGAIQALYGMAFTIKMARKFSGQDYTVAKLEALWWVNGSDCWNNVPKVDWNWMVLIRTPEFIGPYDLKEAKAKLRAKYKPAEIDAVELFRLREGRCVQMLHTGPYDQEPKSIAGMLAFAADHGLKPEGKHHEIYISDPRRVAPEKLRTILRIPVG